MNWLLSANRTRLILFSAVIPFLFSCEKARDIGLGIIPPQELGIFYTDTLTIQASTVLTDSVVTYGASRLLVGQYQDPDFGKVMAKSFVSLYPAADSIRFVKTDSTVLGETITDSLVLKLDYVSTTGTSYSYGENGEAEQTFHVYRLSDSIRLSLKSGEFYTNNSTIPYNSTPLLSFSVKLKDLREKRTLHLKFSDYPSLTDFGKEILDILQKTVATKRAEFSEQFKGLVIVPDAANQGGIVGLLISSRISAHYTTMEKNGTATPTKQNRTFDFFLGFNTGRFNNIQSERSGTSLAGLSIPLTSLASSATNNRTFVEGGLGFYTKLEFPTLDRLKLQGNVAINKAELIIKPVIGSAETYTVPEYLVLHETDNTNKKLISRLRTSTNTFELPFIYNEGQIGATGGERILYDSRNEVFRTVLTSHFQHLLSGDTANKGILIAPANEGASVNRLILNNQNNSPFSMKLRVYYTVFK
jgi:hypothetical protein